MARIWTSGAELSICEPDNFEPPTNEANFRRGPIILRWTTPEGEAREWSSESDEPLPEDAPFVYIGPQKQKGEKDAKVE